MVFFSKVEVAFSIPTRGCVIVPVAVTNTVHNGDAIQLRTPGGDVANTRIVGIEMIKRSPVGFLLSKDVAKADVPPETEICVNSWE